MNISSKLEGEKKKKCTDFKNYFILDFLPMFYFISKRYVFTEEFKKFKNH